MRYLLICFVAVSLFLGCGDSSSANKGELKTDTKMKDADKNQNVMEGYQPSQPIEFSHSIHSGDLGIDCKYCHNSEKDSKSAGLPSGNICKNCHNSASDVASIKELDENDSSESPRQIVWEKVDNVDDNYFNPTSFQAIEAHKRVRIDTNSIDSFKCASCHY